MAGFQLYPWRSRQFAKIVIIRCLVIVVASFAVVFLHDWYIAWRDLTYIGTRGYYTTFVWLYVGGGSLAGIWLADGIHKFRRPMCLQAPTVASASMVVLLSAPFGASYALGVLHRVQIEIVLPLVAVSAVTAHFVCFRLPRRIVSQEDC
jgi:hypothetical protein